MIDIFAIDWQKNKDIPLFIYDWIFDEHSLTSKLKDIYPNFRVQVLSENTLNIENIAFIRREVNLCDMSSPLVRAISFIPKECHELQNLGNTPLGEILFKQGERQNILVAKHNDIWARKSIFTFKNHNITVCEFFLKNLFESDTSYA